MNTRITQLLGIEYPILQGGMAWIAESTLASAVSNGGGAGIIAGGSAPIDYLREQIRKTKSLTDKPFGVNIMLMSPNADDLAQLVIDEKVSFVTTGVSPQQTTVYPSLPSKIGAACITACPVPFCSNCQTISELSSTKDFVTSPPNPTTVIILLKFKGFSASNTYLTIGFSNTS